VFRLTTVAPTVLTAVVSVLPSILLAADLRPEIKDGVVNYTNEDGQRRTIEVGKECIDLWVAPDQSVLAFAGIERTSTPPTDPRVAQLGFHQAPLVEETSLYIAWRSHNFAPQQLEVKPVSVFGQQWSEFRRPSVSPDGQTLYFEVRDSETSSTIMAMSLRSGVLHQVLDASNYCVLWGGAYSGEVLLQIRYLPTNVHQGVIYQCHLRDGNGVLRKVADQCDDLEDFAKEWAPRMGGTCTPPSYSEKW